MIAFEKRCRFGGRHNPVHVHTHTKITTSNRSSASPPVRVGVERHYTVRVPCLAQCGNNNDIETYTAQTVYIYIYVIRGDDKVMILW
ncbi:hypothetical protein FWK35_00003879 [Aphis craccivora]|uniref:Uncharacterized protein n=1 Tax=Aphis craccivora TaxID=307492 RepID=A0A6G0ZN71_APHCR|nr:hypothetical protein FWK35_00003879 [Aphis craccivora]